MAMRVMAAFVGRAAANLRVDLEIHFRHVHDGARRIFQHMGVGRHAGANRENQPSLLSGDVLAHRQGQRD